MGRGIRFLGHPVHPAVIHFPMGLLPFSFLSDLAAWWTQDPVWWRVSFWSLAIGLAAAVPATLTGLVDYAAIPDSEKAAAATANRHMTVLLVALSAYALSFFLRLNSASGEAGFRIGMLASSFLGLILLLWGGWLGGELTFKHGIGQVK